VLLRAHDQRPGVGDRALQLGDQAFVHGSFYNRATPLLREVAMPALRPRARRTTIREVLDTAIELEKKTMALYVGFVKAFPRPAVVRNFWFSMARHEAGDLPSMIARPTPKEPLLGRAAALVERRVGRVARRRGARRAEGA